MVNKFFSRILLAIVLISGIPAVALPAQASNEPCVFGNFEMPLPGLDEEGKTICDYAESLGFVGFVAIFVQLFLGVIVAVGIIAVVVGGYLYMTAGGNGGQVEKAKTWIKSALIGIVLALISYLILDMINPQLASQLREPVCRTKSQCSPGEKCEKGNCIPDDWLDQYDP